MDPSYLAMTTPECLTGRDKKNEHLRSRKQNSSQKLLTMKNSHETHADWNPYDAEELKWTKMVRSEKNWILYWEKNNYKN